VMFENVVLVTESGCDVPKDIQERYGIFIVPMHVQMGEESYDDDGTIPPNLILEYHEKTGKTPTTSGCNVGDFAKVFDEIHERWPEKHILHIAYSAVTTVSYASAVSASEDRDYVRSVDCKQFSVCAASILMELGEMLEANPSMGIEECEKIAYEIRQKRSLYFLPYSLEFLRAGGRLTNAVAFIGKALHLLPCIETHDGRLYAKKKYRGPLYKAACKMLEDVVETHRPSLDKIYFIKNYGTDERLIAGVEELARNLGFQNLRWFEAGATITAHAGPRAFGFVVFDE